MLGGLLNVLKQNRLGCIFAVSSAFLVYYFKEGNSPDDSKSQQYRRLESEGRLLKVLSEQARYNFNSLPFQDFCKELLKQAQQLLDFQMYQRELLKSRVRRRFNRQNTLQYFQIVGMMDNFFKEMLDSSIENLILCAGLKLKDFSQQLNGELERSEQFEVQFKVAVEQIHYNMKSKIKSQKKVSLQKTKQVLIFMIDSLTNDQGKLVKFKEELALNAEQQKFIPVLLDSYLLDEVYARFDVEQQDLSGQEGLEETRAQLSKAMQNVIQMLMRAQVN